MKFLNKFSDKITWETEWGESIVDPSKYRFEFVSRPMSEPIFNKFAEACVQNSFVLMAKASEGVFEVPSGVLESRGAAILQGLPKVQAKGEYLLTKKIVDMSFEKKSSGWVIIIGVEGIRRVG